MAAVINRLQLVEKIDARLPVSKEKGAKVTMGQRVAAMILNGLGFTDDRLYLFPDFLKNKPIERLLGTGLKASDFNDDITGRCLDEITDYGTTPFFTEIAFEIGLAENLLGSSAHFDTTSLTVYGDYESTPIDIRENNVDTDPPFTITHGHSKAHRPDLKQMILNLATTGSGFPIWMEAHSGNASDKKILEGGASRMRSFCEKLKSAPSFLYVGDSAFYERCVKEQVAFKWLSRVPERLNETKRWVEQPNENFTWTSLGDGYKMTPLLDAAYGDVSQRWMMIHSEKAAAREYKTEQGFAFIKGDAFEVSSIFLKKPSRIQALMVVMTLCLMVYSFAQQHLRKALVEANETIPDQLKNPTMKPTMAWVFRLLQGIQIWLVPHGDMVNELVVNLTVLTRRIIGYFGPVAEEIYSSTG